LNASERFQSERFQLFLIILLGIAIRLWAIPTFQGPPYGPVDVYYVDGWAAHSLLTLHDPYSQNYTISVESGVFVYLPFVPIYYAPFYLLGDLRYGNIFADVLIMISLYCIARRFVRRRAVYASLLYAVLPPSIWLSSVSSTNMMIGTAMLVASLAFVINQKFLYGSVFLGIAIATNQFVLLIIPPIVYYFWKRGKMLHLSAAVAIAALIILPFFIPSPSIFSYDVLSFQFVRPLQSNGSFSLYSVLYSLTGFRLTTLVRAGIMVALIFLMMIWLSRNMIRFIPVCALILLLGAFILPVNGFWNYYLLCLALSCTLFPILLSQKKLMTGEPLVT
jgi:uncharacterized membrane protein